MNYKKGYYKLFNEITDLIEQLKKVQQETERIVVCKKEKRKDAKAINNLSNNRTRY